MADCKCFDCGTRETPLGYCAGELFEDGIPRYCCAECTNIRKEFLETKGYALPSEVFCDGCLVQDGVDHECSKEHAVIEEIRTNKQCICRKCNSVPIHAG